MPTDQIGVGGLLVLGTDGKALPYIDRETHIAAHVRVVVKFALDAQPTEPLNDIPAPYRDTGSTVQKESVRATAAPPTISSLAC